VFTLPPPRRIDFILLVAFGFIDNEEDSCEGVIGTNSIGVDKSAIGLRLGAVI
jgi:hypothetical protein